jgi:hypothetical protein
MWRVNSALPTVPAFAAFAPQPGGGGAATVAPSARPAPAAPASFSIFGSDGSRIVPMQEILARYGLSGLPPLVFPRDPSASGCAAAAAFADPAAPVQLQAAAPAPAPAEHVASAATKPRKARACSICHVLWHQRKNCSNALVGGAAGLPPSHPPKSPFDEFAVSPLVVNTSVRFQWDLACSLLVWSRTKS